MGSEFIFGKSSAVKEKTARREDALRAVSALRETFAFAVLESGERLVL